MQEKFTLRFFDNVSSATLHAEQSRADWRAEAGQAEPSQAGVGWGWEALEALGVRQMGEDGAPHLKEPTLRLGPCPASSHGKPPLWPIGILQGPEDEVPMSLCLLSAPCPASPGS